MKRKQIIVGAITPGSIAEEAGIEKGDILKTINGEKIKDIFDYRFLIANEEVVLEIQKSDGDIWEINIEKDEYEDLGLEFESSMMDESKCCTNKCIFCFIDQLPEGMRETLYFKDDDSRLSFLTGNYVTLTNMKDEDIDRIIKYKMSPINVSVHTTNPDLRVLMLKNKFAGDVINKIKRLISSGITVNCQIVLCREVNDGSELDRTLSDLVDLYPGLKSISIVPVGITRYRDNLYNLKPYDKDSSNSVITQIEKWQQQLKGRFGSAVVYIADEFYIMAGGEMPDFAAYEDFPQIENGVGLIAQFVHEFEEYIINLEYKSSNFRKVSIATGVSAFKYIKGLAEILEKRYNNIKINVYQIKNDFFGENVTVTGLITGRDIVNQLKDTDLGSELLICRCMLKAGENLFLDDYTVEMLEQQLNVKLTIVENNGKEFVEKTLAIDN